MTRSKRITIFGASGYTGRLIVDEIVQMENPNWDFQLAGRSAEKLALLADSIPTNPKVFLADPRRPETLKALCQNTDILINCVGPFTDYGEPVVTQAAKNGISYLDISNELGYVHLIKRYDAIAKSNGAAILPACGFEVALADCAARVLADVYSDVVDEIQVIYAIQGQGSSFGTRKSAIRSLGTSWVAYRDGNWHAAIPCQEARTILMDQQPVSILSFPSGEIASIPAHIQTQRVTTWMTVSTPARIWGPIFLPLFARLAHSSAGQVFAWLSTLTAPTPKRGLRSHSPFMIQVIARKGLEQHTATLRGYGVYDLTAKIVGEAIRQMSQPDFAPIGILSPAMAMDSHSFLETASQQWDVKITYESQQS